MAQQTGSGTTVVGRGSMSSQEIQWSAARETGTKVTGLSLHFNSHFQGMVWYTRV